MVKKLLARFKPTSGIANGNSKEPHRSRSPKTAEIARRQRCSQTAALRKEMEHFLDLFGFVFLLLESRGFPRLPAFHFRFRTAVWLDELKGSNEKWEWCITCSCLGQWQFTVSLNLWLRSRQEKSVLSPYRLVRC